MSTAKLQFKLALESLKEGESLHAKCVDSSNFKIGSTVKITFNPNRHETPGYPYDIKGVGFRSDREILKYSQVSSICRMYDPIENEDEQFLHSLYR